MSTKYKANVPGKAYFITITTVNWVDIFTRLKQRYLIVNSINYCIEHKGLEVYAYCLMPSHLHMICRADDETKLCDIIRDFKKFTSKKIIENIQEGPESRREWILEMFAKACEHLVREQHYKVWQDGYHAEILESVRFTYQKLDYVHNNPVADKLVQHPEDYLFSSARNYAGLDSMVEKIVVLPHRPVAFNR
jgi:REP element-mobilizing transposase RayT